MLCANDKGLLRINLKGSITSPGIRPGNLKSTRIGHVKVKNISFFPWVKTLRLKLKACGFFSLMLDEGIDWTGEKATAIYTTSVKNSGIYKLSEVDCLDACHYYSYAGAAHEYSWLWASFYFYFYEKVQHSFALKLKNSFYQCHAGWAKKHSRLRGDGIKNNKQPLHNNKQAIEEVIFVNTDMLSSGWFFYFFANYLLYGCIIIKVGVFIVFLQQYGKCNPPSLPPKAGGGHRQWPF